MAQRSKGGMMAEHGSIEELVSEEVGKGRRSVHVECSREMGRRALDAVREVQGARRGAYFLEEDGGFDRDTVRSYLRFFARLAGAPSSAVTKALAHFGLEGVARTMVAQLDPEQRALLGFARMSLFEPEVCFCERPLLDLGPDARALVLAWIGERSEAGTLFVTVGQPLREALLMPGEAFWEEEGLLRPAVLDEGGETAAGDGADDLADEVRVCKIAAKAGEATLLLDPREIDFIESADRVNYASVRGELYPTTFTMDELEERLVRFGFFRCHRSYIVNVQKVSRVERYTRNTFDLVLSDASRTSIPLSKGRAEEMRDRFGW